MKEVIKTKLVKALKCRSYKQGSDFLHSKVGSKKRFCALGVLTDLYLREKEGCWSYFPQHSRFKEGDEIIYVGFSSSSKAAIKNETKAAISPQVMRWAGVADPYIEIPNLLPFRNDKRRRILEGGGTIGSLNDGGWSFPAIAEIINKAF